LVDFDSHHETVGSKLVKIDPWYDRFVGEGYS